jgi:hypothetical protein
MDATNKPDLSKMNRKTRWYYKHRENEEHRQKWAEAKKRYYEKNKEHYKQKALERYYKIKAEKLLNVPVSNIPVSV